MVVAFLVNQFFPSNRGLQRKSTKDLVSSDTATTRSNRVGYNTNNTNNNTNTNSNPTNNTNNNRLIGRPLPVVYAQRDVSDRTFYSLGNWPSFCIDEQQEQQQQQQQEQQQQQDSYFLSEDNPYESSSGRETLVSGVGTIKKRKEFRAMSLLTSVASDFDLVSDWLFLHHTYANRGLVPSSLIWGIFVACVIGTIFWLALATDGRIVSPILKLFRKDHLSMGMLLFFCVVFEDIPQVVLTFLVEDYYDNDALLSDVAVCNLLASLYDTLIKLAEAFDERNDLVETGTWCKNSVWVHKKPVTQLLVLPLLEPDGLLRDVIRNKQLPPCTTYASSTTTNANAIPLSNSSGSSLHQNQTFQHKPSFLESVRSTLHYSPFVEALLPPENINLPRISFMTTSEDKTIRLWEIASIRDHRNRRVRKIRTYRGHVKGVTCIAWLGNQQPSNNTINRTNSNLSQGNNNNSISSSNSSNNNNNNNNNKQNKYHGMFLTGCKSGNIKLWTLDGVCVRNFQIYASSGSVSNAGNAKEGVTAIATVRQNNTSSYYSGSQKNNQIFVSAYENGISRLWQISTGVCIGHFHGHEQPVSSLCFMQNGEVFVSASMDSTLKLWDTNRAMLAWDGQLAAGGSESVVAGNTAADANDHDDGGGSSSMLPKVAPYILVADPDINKETNSTMTFIGHTGPVLSLACVHDRTAILSGSKDGTARLWSATSGRCLRVFRGHTGAVTAVTPIDQATFLTGSGDKTIKAWDALSGTCLRTYTGHTNTITSLSVIITFANYDDDGNDHSIGNSSNNNNNNNIISSNSTVPPPPVVGIDDDEEEIIYFLSSSTDRTVKVWVLTTIPPKKEPEATLDQILDMQDLTCKCFHPQEQNRVIV